jgi:hypothetical protein
MVYEQQAPILLVIGFPSVFTSTSTRLDLGLYLQSVSFRWFLFAPADIYTTRGAYLGGTARSYTWRRAKDIQGNHTEKGLKDFRKDDSKEKIPIVFQLDTDFEIATLGFVM